MILFLFSGYLSLGRINLLQQLAPRKIADKEKGNLHFSADVQKGRTSFLFFLGKPRLDNKDLLPTIGLPKIWFGGK